MLQQRVARHGTRSRRLAAICLAATGIVSTVTLSIGPSSASAVLPAGSLPAGTITLTSLGGTSFRIAVPAAAACPGDSATQGNQYFWSTFLTGSGVDITQATFNGPGGITGPASAQVDYLYSLSQPVFDQNTAITTGAVVGLPNSFDFSIFPANYLNASDYQLGVACTKGGAVERYWATNVQFTKNGSGLVTGFSLLSVAPSAPTVSASPTVGISGQISGTIVPVVGTPPVTSYSVTATPAVGSPVSVTVTPPSTSYQFTGLTNDTLYTITATATNTVGTSAASAGVTATPFAAAAPTAPTVVSPLTVGVSGRISGSITPVTATPAVTSYTVTATPAAGSPVSVTVTPPATTFQINGLTNRTLYTVTVTATNTVGTSSASAGVTATPYVANAAPIAVSAGAAHSCASLTGGTVRCWGSNTKGQLGNGTLVASTAPVVASGLTGVTQISSGDLYNCAVTGGKVKCWGDGATGQLGNGSLTTKSTPTFVTTAGTTALTGVTKVATGTGFACALLTPGVNGTVRCWGLNSSGQLGDGTTTLRTRPVAVKANATTVLKGVTNIAAGGATACAQLTTGAVRCWGLNTSGQLGNNTLVNAKLPVAVTGINGVALKATSIAVGANFACARLTTGAVRCWGNNASGQLGNNTTTTSKVPVVVKTSAAANLAGATSVQAGSNFACVVRGTGTAARVSCWGNNANGQLGIGSTTNTKVATALTSTTVNGIKALALGTTHAVAVVPSTVRTPSDVAGWGRNANGQLGVSGTPKTSPTIAILV
ncbi:MAG: fibronectin type III domain-containing protein [Ilumatobacteraceae bacterium]